jgi:putative membrane protein insertion efficiency factor
VKRFARNLLLALIGAYQRWISPAFPRRCKYEPTCSHYAAEAVLELGPLRGSIVAGWRLLRCNPLSDGGIDDVADRSLFREHKHPHGDSERSGSVSA